MLEERHAGSSLASTQYVWDPLAVDTLVERDQDTNGNGTLSERLYIQQDANSNVTALVNTTGNVVERYVYSPFGTVTVLSPTWGERGSSAYAMSNLFQGGRYDDDIGDYRFGAREYRPTIEVWTSQDPLGYQAGPNLYQFVGDNPTLATDPTGKDVYLETYGSSSNPGEQSSDSLCSPSNAYHQRICVDTWNAQGAFSGRRCFSFRGTGYRWPTFSSTWLGHDSCQCGCILNGIVYEDKTNEVYKTDKQKKTTKEEDARVLAKLEGLVDTEAGYSLARHNCRAFSQWEFAAVTGTETTPSQPPSTCFPAGTAVATQAGPKPIEFFRPGDQVLGFNLVTGEWLLPCVAEAYEHDYEGKLLAITVAGEVIEATDNHPFWVIEGQGLEPRGRPLDDYETPPDSSTPGLWVDAGNLRVGDVLRLKPDRQAPVTRLAVRQVRQKVYNILLDEDVHAYAVGASQVMVMD